MSKNTDEQENLGKENLDSKKDSHSELKRKIEDLKTRFSTFPNKYQKYIIKRSLIWISFLTVFIFFIIYSYNIHFRNEENVVNLSVINKIASIILNTAVVFIPFIPLFIWDLDLRKKFKEDKDQLKDLKMKLINVRYEMVCKLIDKLKDEGEKSLLFNKLNLKKYKNPLYLDVPIIINDITSKLRKFNLYYGDDRPYADVFGFIARYERFLDLYALEEIIYGSIVLLKNYGEGDEYKQLEEGTITEITLEEIEESLKEEDYSSLRTKFLWDLNSVLIYIQHKKEPNRLKIYRDGLKSDIF